MTERGRVLGVLTPPPGIRTQSPFLFFRDDQGHVRWWSFAELAARVTERLETAPGPETAGSAVRSPESVVELLVRAAQGETAWPSDSEIAAVTAAIGPAEERDIWVSYRSWSEPAERRLLGWALATGAAVFLAALPELLASSFVWARPTVVAGPLADLIALAADLEQRAPRFARARWMRQRRERLRTVVVEASGAGAVERLAREAPQLVRTARVAVV